VTFAQLRAFATVARLGSVKESARELGVSEPAVSGAIAALRRELGDDLVTRAGGGVRLTAGGARLASVAGEILGLAGEAKRAVEEARGATTRLRVAATSDVAEHVAAPLIDAFTRRAQATEVELQVEPPESFARLLADRLADVVLGPRPAPAAAIDSRPFLRYRLIVVAAPGHRLARWRRIPAAALAGERWLVGPSGAGAGTATGTFFELHGLEPDELRAFPSHAAAAIGAEAGRGVMLAVAHTVMDELGRGTLIRLDVRGTPLEELWHLSALSHDRRPAAASALRNFAVTPEATQAMLARSGDVPAGRFRPALYVTLWDAVQPTADS
jgi:molybdate transport repressor ModE-like protein